MYKNNSCSGEISLDYIRSGLQVSWLYHQSRFWCLFFCLFWFFFLFQKLDSDVTCNIRCWLSLVVPLCVLGAVQSTCNYILLWLHWTGLFHPTWCYNFYNPGQKSLGQYCNIHIFLLFLGSLLKQYILFETFLQFSLPHTTKSWNSEKILDTRVQHCFRGEGRSWACVNWKTPKKCKSVPRLLSMIVE